MNRRESLKAIGLTSLSTALLLETGISEAQQVPHKKKAPAPSHVEPVDNSGRQPFEIERDKQLHAERFFNPHEMATITVLADIIIPRDAKSGSASDAKVPDFIEFIVKDQPANKTPMRGGLHWLDVKCSDQFGKKFIECTHDQQIDMVTQIAYPKKAKPDMRQGVAFFNRMRDMTASGFFTSKIGLADIGYMGNTPGKWEGVPADVLKQHGFDSAWG
jgi:hypothetical protein